MPVRERGRPEVTFISIISIKGERKMGNRLVSDFPLLYL